LKVCVKCGLPRILDEYDKGRATCVVCRRELDRQKYAANLEQQRQRQRDARAAEPDRIRSREKSYWAVRKPLLQEKRQRWNIRVRKPRKALGRAFVDAARAGGCIDCGEKDLRVLDSDHVRGKKLYEISDLLARPLSVLFAELDKCDTRCANCHRRITDERRKAA